MTNKLETLNNFLDTINNPEGKNYHRVEHLMSLFADNNGNLPFVGITLRGPQFTNRDNIQTLFVQLLNKTFPDMAWTPADQLRMTDGNTVAIEVDVTGTQHDTWFQDKFKSHPLSQIDGPTLAELSSNNKKNKMDIPACMVFTFNDQGKIQQLAIYMDRYRMMQHLAPGHWQQIHLAPRH